MQESMYERNSGAALALLLLIKKSSSFGGESNPQELIEDASTESQFNVAITGMLLRGQNRTMKGVITLD
jgi:hypothetical protein